MLPKWIIQEARKILEQSGNEKGVWCFLCGGVKQPLPLKGMDWGGRNLELALASVEKIKDINEAYFVTFATDGEGWTH